METQERTIQKPAFTLKTSRGLLKFILLNIITFGIYSLVFFSTISDDVNLVCTRYDGRKTMHYCLLVFLVSPITLGIAGLVWFHRISDRIGNELIRRNVGYRFSSGSFWLWYILGSMLFGVGPLVYIHKLAKAMNKLNENYNING
jgi:hypothetical protein